ncbi:YtxH domain-containing protein [Sporosarcina sp. Sa2YVA2]|uniref:YtxH domain-containing protein n=1 Tax=Sporosarcina quadrami TaxID=2762234 RepID=A0ABR8U8H8_9BACL|nr:YtxH domain-containing protein [Sporosarcina quadrami]MBD7984337.1 YtxH domain-containing protein [Sporosarcina quadrami]
MTDRQKPNYNDSQYDHHYHGEQDYKNSFGEAAHLPVTYPYQYNTDDFYEDDSSNAGSFLLGALVGGVIGAAAALFLAPKTGREMREDFTEQATQIKNKSIELSSVAKDKTMEFSSVAKDKASEFSSVAKDKATEFSSAAKEKTEDLSKSIQEQSGQIVDKVKSMTNKTSIPMDDGTVSSEGEEAVDYVENSTNKNKEAAKDKTTGNSDVSYNNSENVGKNKVMNQNQISVEEKK